MPASRWIISVDGGGSKTDMLLVNVIKGSGVATSGGGINPNVYGVEGLQKIGELLELVLSHEGCTSSQVAQCVLGMAGIGNPAYRRAVEEHVMRLLPGSKLTLVTDAEMAQRSIWGLATGITLIVGTGSVAVGIDEQGVLHRAGGFGYQAGDEGSGYWLGKTVLTELIVSEQSNDEQVTALRDALLDHFGCSDFEALLEDLSAAMDNVVRLAGIAPIILQLAEQRNSLASRIVNRGAEYLADLVRELSEKMGTEHRKLRVGISGSVITGSEFYQSQVENHLLLHFDSVEWLISGFPPVYGGLMLTDNWLSVTDMAKLRIVNI